MLLSGMTIKGLLRIAASLSAFTAVMLIFAPAAPSKAAVSGAHQHPDPRLGSPSHRPNKGRNAHARTSVIGGMPAAQGAFPAMAFIIDEIPGAYGLCSGTVVSPHLVLTAGHCAVDLETGYVRPASGYAVVTGNADWTASPRQVSGVSQVLPYPGYYIGGPLEGYGDAALLVLSTPTSAPAIPLATSADTSLLRGGTGADIVGWGDTIYEQEEPTTQLQWAKTVVQSEAYCNAHISSFHPRGQICTIDPPSYSTGVCHGDSGGPLLAAGANGSGLVEIGVTSTTGDECSPALPDVFTRADLISPWVKGRIATYDPSSPPSQSGPATSLPTLTGKQAEAFVRRGLTEDFGATFTHRLYYRAKCHRINGAKVECGVSWSHGPNDFYGWVTVYYVLENAEVLWNDRYAIHWVNDHCYFHSRHRGRCRVHTRRR